MNNVSIYEKNWLDLVFEGKNQEYGAYQLRQQSPRTTLLALFYGITILCGVIGIFVLSSFLSKPETTTSNPIIDEPVVVCNYPVQKPETNKPETQQQQNQPPQKEPTNRSNMVVAQTDQSQDVPENDNIAVSVGEEVDLIISHITELGINVIINNLHKGILYKNQVFEEVRTGDRLVGYIKNIRPDNKIDVSLQKIGFENIEPNAEKILSELKASRGFLRLNDNSHPDDIKNVLKMSKKTFKKAIGSLYKDKQIDIKEDGIYLLNK